MTNSLEEFQAKFQVEEMTILKLDHWTWSVRPVQCTLGASIISLNRYCASLGSLTCDEAAEFGIIVRELETRIRKSFKAEKFNYMALMMVDSHLHFHVAPRYSAVQSFAGKQWPDPGWPALPQLQISPDGVSLIDLAAIRDTLK